MDNLLIVERYDFEPDWTIGRLLINKVKDGFVVEDQIRKIGQPKVHGETAIPFGRYALSFRQSPKFSAKFLWSDAHKKLVWATQRANFPEITDFRDHDLIWLKDVPNFQFILVHWGNTDKDTEGCLIVGAKLGMVEGREGVVESRVYYQKMYERVYPIIKAGGQFISVQRAV